MSYDLFLVSKNKFGADSNGKLWWILNSALFNRKILINDYVTNNVVFFKALQTANLKSQTLALSLDETQTNNRTYLDNKLGVKRSVTLFGESKKNVNS